MVQALKAFGMGQNKIEMKIQEEIKYIVERLDASDGQPMDIRHLLNYATVNVISSVVLGERYKYGDAEFNEWLKNVGDALQIPTLGKSAWFRYIPWDPFQIRKYINKMTAVTTLYSKKMDEHLSNFNPNNINDLIDAYIQEMNEEDRKEENLTNTEELLRLIHELFLAGSETTATVIKWGLVYLIRHPDVQSTVYNELNDNVPQTRFLSSNDKPNLPYLQATIDETLRLTSAVPVIGRASTKDINYKGFTIPKSATLLANLHSVAYAEGQWDEPTRFDPSRFLKGNDASQKKQKQFPFGLGARICPGESFARMELYLIMGALLQRYEFLPAPGGDAPELEGTFGKIRAPFPFKLRAVRRDQNI